MNNLLRHCRPLAAALILFYAACVWAQSAEMVFVPAGEFEMGDSFAEGDPDELPVHTVYLSPYYIDKYEVTNGQYADSLNWAYTQGGLIHVSGGVVYQYGSGNNYPYCATTGGSVYSRITWDGNTFIAIAGKEAHPITEVSWYGAVAYCNWRSTMEGMPLCFDLEAWTCDFGIGGYRLPTEAEWEKAAGWDSILEYHFRFGEHTDGCGTGCLGGQRANYASSGDPFETGPYPWTTPAGYYDGTSHGGYQTQNAQSFYGCYDMSGNVWEWCYDWYSSTHYSGCPEADPTGPTTGTHRVLHGGGWNSTPINCRSAKRLAYPAATHGLDEGFRCVVGTWSGYPDPLPESADGDQSDVSGSEADPVNTATGNFFHAETDLSAPTRGGLTAFTRSYNSMAATSSRRPPTLRGQHHAARSPDAASSAADARAVWGGVGLPSPARRAPAGEQVAFHWAIGLSVVLLAVLGVGLALWLLERRTNGGTQGSRGQLEAARLQRTVAAARDHKAVEDSGRRGSSLARFVAGEQT